MCGYDHMNHVQYWQLGSVYVNHPIFSLHHSAKEPIMQQTTEEISLQVRDGIVLSIEKKEKNTYTCIHTKLMNLKKHKIDEYKETNLRENWMLLYK